MGLVLPTAGQTFRITGFTTGPQGEFRVRYGSDTNFYYLLLKGNSVSNVNSPAAIVLGTNGLAEFLSAPNPASATFYRLRRVPMQQPLDTDGDGVDDVTELLQPASFNPLVPDIAFATILSSPLPGETDVAVTRETILDFSMPLHPSTVLTTNHLYATYGGRRLLSRIELSSDRRKATLFYLEPLPGSTRVTVTFDGNGLTDFLGRPIDADGDFIPGGTAIIRFDTLSLTPLANTAVIGHVFASEQIAGTNTTNFINRPLAGVTISVDGREQDLRTTTDTNGFFKLQPVPSGRFFVHVDGRTAVGSQWPNGNYYPVVGKAWEAVPGREDNLAGGNGEIFLPLIIQGTLQPVSATTNTTVGFPPAVIQKNPELAGVSVTVPANSLFSDSGTRGGRVGIAPVPADRLPEPLPPGLNLPLVITLQTDGPSNFDRPVPVRFPNLPDPITGETLPPGAKSALWSFNHDTGTWEIVGPMTVSADGQYVETDPGVGIRQPGWHGTQPGAGAGGGPLSGPPCDQGGGGKNCHQNPDFRPDDEANYNGCGPDGLDYLVPDNPNLPYFCASFFPACRSHDIGYNTCGKPQQQTDDQFLQDMIAQCNCIASDLDREACILTAQLYHAAVTSGGEDAYNAAQEKACICEEPPSCGAPPPGPGPGPGPEALARYKALLKRTAKAGTEPLPADYVPQTGPHRFAVIDLETGEVIQRGRAGSAGIAFTQLILRPNKAYDILILQEATLWEGRVGIVTGPSGSFIEIPAIVVRPPVSWDFDGDGLHDAGELIMGTDRFISDTDDDGINDGSEVLLSLNPLGAAPLATGVISAADTPGIAVDVSALNNFVAVADSAAGVAIFNAQGINPIRTAQVNTPGDAQRVSWSGAMIAVADGPSGLAVIDASDPSIATLVRQVPVGNATAVAAAAGLAYVGLQSGHVTLVEMATGTVLRRTIIGAAIWDLAFGGDYLYALSDSTLFVIEIAGGDLTVIRSVASPTVSTPNRRLSIGGGRAYATHGKGFNTFDLTDPVRPVLLNAGNTAQFGWEHIVPSGSGLGVAAVGTAFAFDQQRVFSLYDISSPTGTNQFVTAYQHAGHARAVSVFNGLAYGAAHDAGLLVINYLAFDTQEQPPTIGLSADFSLNPAQAEEGKIVRLTAEVTDDVQVRNVQFYVDGILVATDGNFPFEHRFITPQRTASVSNFTVRAVAFDTGGNRAETSTITVQLVPDASPPRVVGQSPDRGQIVGTTDTLAAFFNEPIDVATLSSATLTLTFAGADGVFGNGDDSIVSGGALEYRSALNGAFLTFPAALGPGVYRASVRPPLADLAGNALARDANWEFLVLGSVDSDLDGVPDNVESLLGLNPNNPDSNNNGILDGDEDPDGDGLRTAWELAYGYDPRVKDSNGDTVFDGNEDSDNDRLTNLSEQLARTNPTRADTDGDLWSDEAEVSGQGDPLDPTVGPRLFLVATPRVAALVTGPPQQGAIQLGTVMASPPTTVLVPGLGQLSGINFGLVMARPPVRVLTPGLGALDSVALGTVVARPPLAVLSPGFGALDSTTQGTVLARPPTKVLVPGLGALDSLSSLGTLIARPPLNVLVPGIGATNAIPPSTLLALPPVTVEFDPQ